MRRAHVAVAAVLVLGVLAWGALAFPPAGLDDAPTTTTAGPADAGSTSAGPGSAPGDVLDPELAFEDVAVERGFDYVGNSSHRLLGLMGDAGVYATDYDGDGWTDLLALGGAEPVLYRNDAGTLRPSGALPALDRRVRFVLFFDVDRDGDQDLLALSMNRTPLLLENDGATFSVVPDAFDQRLSIPTAAAAADYDGDGCLDVFVAQESSWLTRVPEGMGQSATYGADNGEPNLLLAGDCEGGFVDVTAESGISGDRWSLATSFLDLTGDGRPDVHVANDFNEDVLYVNRGDGTFEQRFLGPSTDRNAMSSEIADVDGDGRLDVYVTNIYYPPWVAEILDGLTVTHRSFGNNLLHNEGGGNFTDAAGDTGAIRGGWGWAASMSDFDNDGDWDLVHTTMPVPALSEPRLFDETEREQIRVRHPYYRYPALWRGTSEGFTEVNASLVGFRRSDGRGLATLDVDRDGDLDLALATTEGRYRLYENVARDAGSAIQVDLAGDETTTPSGARVTVVVDGERHVRARHSRSDYLSQESRVVHVGTGTTERVSVAVSWPDGETYRYEDVQTGARIVLRPDGSSRRIPFEE